jgi:hypothetical protein
MTYISFSFSLRTIGTARVLAADSLSPSSEEFLIHLLEWRLKHITDTGGYLQNSMLGGARQRSLARVWLGHSWLQVVLSSYRDGGGLGRL